MSTIAIPCTTSTCGSDFATSEAAQWCHARSEEQERRASKGTVAAKAVRTAGYRAVKCRVLAGYGQLLLIALAS